MSWDLLIMAAPPGVRMEDTKEEQLRLGTRDEVVAAVRAALPQSELEGRYLRVEGDTYAIELNLGDEEHVNGLGVRAQGDEATVEVLQRLCAHTGWRALDYSTGDFLDESEDPATGLRGWRALRDSAVDDG
ncbi:MAG TPA: hypothetical protein VFX80_10280 [Solirubrobacteraceae bacterium]|nr:hypothetical protein [Solirubrobacteraceae bacterium]